MGPALGCAPHRLTAPFTKPTLLPPHTRTQSRLAKALKGAPRADLHGAVLKRVAKLARAAGRAALLKKLGRGSSSAPAAEDDAPPELTSA